MVSASRWQQSPLFEPANTGQMIQEHYTGLPGGYSSFYFDQIETGATLAGLGHARKSTGGKAPMQLLGLNGLDNYQLFGASAVFLGIVATGYLAWKQRDLIAHKLGRRKKPLSGARRRRRSRRK